MDAQGLPAGLNVYEKQKENLLKKLEEQCIVVTGMLNGTSTGYNETQFQETYAFYKSYKESAGQPNESDPMDVRPTGNAKEVYRKTDELAAKRSNEMMLKTENLISSFKSTKRSMPAEILIYDPKLHIKIMRDFLDKYFANLLRKSATIGIWNVMPYSFFGSKEGSPIDKTIDYLFINEHLALLDSQEYITLLFIKNSKIISLTSFFLKNLVDFRSDPIRINYGDYAKKQFRVIAAEGRNSDEGDGSYNLDTIPTLSNGFFLVSGRRGLLNARFNKLIKRALIKTIQGKIYYEKEQMSKLLPQLIVKFNMMLDYNDYDKNLIDEKKLNSGSILFGLYQDQIKMNNFKNSSSNDAFDELALLHFVIMRTIHVDFSRNLYNTIDLRYLEDYKKKPRYYRSIENFPLVQGVGFLLDSLSTVDLTAEFQNLDIIDEDYIKKTCKDYYIGKNLVENFGFNHYGLGTVSPMFSQIGETFTNSLINAMISTLTNPNYSFSMNKEPGEDLLLTNFHVDILFDQMIIVPLNVKYSMTPFFVDYIKSASKIRDWESIKNLNEDNSMPQKNNFTNLTFSELFNRISAYGTNGPSANNSLLDPNPPELKMQYSILDNMFMDSTLYDYGLWTNLKILFQPDALPFSSLPDLDDLNKETSFLSKMIIGYNAHLNKVDIEMAKSIVKRFIESRLEKPILDIFSRYKILEFVFLKEKEDFYLDPKKLHDTHHEEYFEPNAVFEPLYGFHWILSFQRSWQNRDLQDFPGSPNLTKLSTNENGSNSSLSSVLNFPTIYKTENFYNSWVSFIRYKITQILFYVYYTRFCDKSYYENNIPNYYINLSIPEQYGVKNYELLRRSIVRFSKLVPYLGFSEIFSRDEKRGGQKRQRTKEIAMTSKITENNNTLRFCVACGEHAPGFFSQEAKGKIPICSKICHYYHYIYLNGNNK
jgi:hypothetical protein